MPPKSIFAFLRSISTSGPSALSRSSTTVAAGVAGLALAARGLSTSP